jgi:hypothetical protein
MVPFETQAEFQQPQPPAMPAQLIPLELMPVGRDPLPTEERPDQSKTQLREALVPHLARLMMNKLVSALFSQRAYLMKTQDESAVHVAELEQRLLKVQEQFQARLNTYQKRIAELECELAAQKEENRELVRAKVLLARKAMEAEQRRERAPVDLRDAGFLLRT